MSWNAELSLTRYNMDEYEYDEGSDLDNWETEQVFQDHEGDDDEIDEAKDPKKSEVAVDKFLDDLLKILEN